MDIASSIIAILFIVGLLALAVYFIWKSRNKNKPSYMVSEPQKLTKEEKAAAKEAKKAEKSEKKAEKAEKKSKK